MAIDFSKVKQEALTEVEKEKTEEAKKRYKAKLQELEKAKKVVRNIEREIEDLSDELSND